MVRVRVSREHSGCSAVLAFLQVVDAHDGEHVLNTLKRPVHVACRDIIPDNLRSTRTGLGEKAEWCTISRSET